MRGTFKIAGLLLCAGATLVQSPAARACGCFAPPDPSVPVVQAGERILFALDGTKVTAHIQIQYAGDAKDFGWILPLPSLPKLDLGSDELFTQITTQTQPKYRLTSNSSCNRGGGLFGAAEDAANAPGAGGAGGPLVIQDSIGPYDYAVLKADNKDEMLNWLKANRYVIPTGTDTVVTPYIHPGGYFLALKLKSGKRAGDIQPVVINYNSDLPMIPIVLTSVAANPDMGIQVWMLGAGRAIPRNYYHTVINEAVIDWQSAGSNYNDVIIRATKEAKERHTFVTEYAGTSSVMKNVLNPVGRFGRQSDLNQLVDPILYTQYLLANGFLPVQTNFGGFPQQQAFSGTLLAILEGYIPMPQSLVQRGVTPGQYYAQLAYYLGDYRRQNPAEFNGLDFNYDPVKLTKDIWDRVVTPIQNAARLFDAYPYLTRLYTTLSPENMTRDPVFSYNPELPDVSNVHNATIDYHCDIFGKSTGATITTESGLKIELPNGFTPAVDRASLPASARIELLRESGAPEVVTDNQAAIKNALGGGAGCSVSPGSSRGAAPGALLLALGLLSLVARRRRS